MKKWKKTRVEIQIRMFIDLFNYVTHNDKLTSENK